MIQLTDNAKNRIIEQLAKRGKGLGIRMSVKTTGCSGLAYVLDYVDEKNPDDHILEYDTFSIFVDPDASRYLTGMTVDYQKQGFNECFSFINPNESGRCGCGESFSV